MMERWHFHARHIIDSIEKINRYKTVGEIEENTMPLGIIWVVLEKIILDKKP